MSLPQVDIPLGAIRFNSDSQKLEYWMGSAWMQIKTFSPNLGNSNAGVRGLFAGKFDAGFDGTTDPATYNPRVPPSRFGENTCI